MDHDNIGSLTVEQLSHVLLYLLDKLICASCRHYGVNRFQSQVLIDCVLILGNVKHVMFEGVHQQLFEVWLETSEVKLSYLFGILRFNPGPRNLASKIDIFNKLKRIGGIHWCYCSQGCQGLWCLVTSYCS